MASPSPSQSSLQVVRPHWPLHTDDKDRPVTIYTLAVHPDGSRVATGGLDTKIKIWSTKPILDEATEKNNGFPKLLCTMTSHSGAVMCVRWANSGRTLASGSDDNIVMIWNVEAGSGGKVWGSTESNVENWKASRRLVGHESDVAGVAWSPDDSYLASVGLDSTVLVWSGATYQLVRKLDGHQGFVKGVVFDPVGQYIASQSDDNSVRIWRTDDWGLEANIVAPFSNSPKTAQARLTWSPDGTHIVTPNSMNGPVFVAAVIDRGSWTSQNSMVGHENIVEVSAFNPLIFLRDASKPADGNNLCTLLALSARSSISLWITSQSQPLVVLDDIFDRNVLDLSWSADGRQLWACSSEGHIAVITLALAEFQTVAPPGTKEEYHRTAYSYKKRAPLVHRAPLSQTSSLSNAASGGTMAKPNALVARKGPGAKRVVVRQQPIASTSQLPPSNAFQPPPITHAGPIPTGMGVPPPNAAWGGAFPQVAAVAGPSKKRKADRHSGYGAGREDDYSDDDDIYGSATRLSHAPYRTKGRTLGDGEGARRERPELRVLRPAYLPREKEITFAVTNKAEAGGKGIKVLAVPDVLSFGTLRVEDSASKDTFEWRNLASGEREGTSEVGVVAGSKVLWVDYLPKYVVCAAGSPRFTATSLEDGSLIVYSPTGRRLLPTLVLDSPCSFLEADGVFLMAITALGSLTVWNTLTSKAIVPTLSISSLLTSTATRDVPHPEITTAALKGGVPLISLSSGTSHSYDSDLTAWTRLSEAWWSKGSDFWERGRGKASNTSGRGVIRTIESGINDFVVDAMDVAGGQNGSSAEQDTVTVPSGPEPNKARLGDDEDTFRNALSLGHLETRMKAAIAMNSATEYRTFLGFYAKKLSDEGFRSKAEELAKELLGPVYFKPGTEQTWTSTILGHKKRDLLKDVLNIWAKGSMIKTLSKEYQDILSKVNESF